MLHLLARGESQTPADVHCQDRWPPPRSATVVLECPGRWADGRDHALMPVQGQRQPQLPQQPQPAIGGIDAPSSGARSTFASLSPRSRSARRSMGGGDGSVRSSASSSCEAVGASPLSQRRRIASAASGGGGYLRSQLECLDEQAVGQAYFERIERFATQAAPNGSPAWPPAIDPPIGCFG